jgi:ornithine cyclodeaminase
VFSNRREYLMSRPVCPATAGLSTLFLDTSDVVTLVHRLGLGRSIQGLVQAIEADFRRWESFHKCARIASHAPAGVVELMPIADARQHAFKFVNGHPGNPTRGLPTVMAYGGLADMDTGAPRLISEMTLTTALRTAAMSALAARTLARPGSRCMALIGNGAQSEFQALAMAHVLDLRRLRLFDIDAVATDKLMRNLERSGVGFEIERCGNIAEAVRGADIVTTVTADKSRATIITPDMLRPGQHFNAVGGDCPGKTELHPQVLRAASVFVEYEPQTRIEGDLQQMPADFAVTEFWQVLAARHPGRRSAQEITVFDSVGFALEDFSALRWLAEQAQALSLGRQLSLVPGLVDPKDLFGLLHLPVRVVAGQALLQAA